MSYAEEVRRPLDTQCLDCEGTGSKLRRDEASGGWSVTSEYCEACDGSGVGTRSHPMVNNAI